MQGKLTNHENYTIGIKLSIYIQQNWKVKLQKNNAYNYIDKIYFSLYANCSLVTNQPTEQF